MFYRFSVDDNIRFLWDLARERPASMFDHPYMGFWRELHERYAVKVQLNLFYENMEGTFRLSEMTDSYKEEWEGNADWLRVSFHSRRDKPRFPYQDASRETAREDAEAVHREILRFAGAKSLEYFTTLHYCQASPEAMRGLSDAGIKGMMGLFGTEEAPCSCYNLDLDASRRLCREERLYSERDGMWFFNNSLILNKLTLEEILPELERRRDCRLLDLMIHEQFFYPDHSVYQEDFREKCRTAVEYAVKAGRTSLFLRECAQRL